MGKSINKSLSKISAFFVVAVFAITTMLFTGCSSKVSQSVEIFQNTVYSHLILKEGNKTTENFRLNYSLAKWETQQEKENFLQEVEVFFEETSNLLEVHYKTLLLKKEVPALEMPSKFTSVLKEGENIILVASFPNRKTWQGVSVDEDLSSTSKKETGFLTHTSIESFQKMGSIIEIAETKHFVGDVFFEQVFDFLQNKNYDNVLESSQIKNVFAYATESSRIKSDAESVANIQGKYFHFWNITSVDDVKLTFFFRYARVESWYALALLLAFLSLAIVFVVSYFKKLLKSSKTMNNDKKTLNNMANDDIESKNVKKRNDLEIAESKKIKAQKKETEEKKNKQSIKTKTNTRVETKKEIGTVDIKNKNHTDNAKKNHSKSKGYKKDE